MASSMRCLCAVIFVVWRASAVKNVDTDGDVEHTMLLHHFPTFLAGCEGGDFNGDGPEDCTGIQNLQCDRKGECMGQLQGKGLELNCNHKHECVTHKWGGALVRKLFSKPEQGAVHWNNGCTWTCDEAKQQEKMWPATVTAPKLFSTNEIVYGKTQLGTGGWRWQWSATGCFQIDGHNVFLGSRCDSWDKAYLCMQQGYATEDLPWEGLEDRVNTCAGGQGTMDTSCCSLLNTDDVFKYLGVQVAAIAWSQKIEVGKFILATLGFAGAVAAGVESIIAIQEAAAGVAPSVDTTITEVLSQAKHAGRAGAVTGAAYGSYKMVKAKRMEPKLRAEIVGSIINKAMNTRDKDSAFFTEDFWKKGKLLVSITGAIAAVVLACGTGGAATPLIAGIFAGIGMLNALDSLNVLKAAEHNIKRLMGTVAEDVKGVAEEFRTMERFDQPADGASADEKEKTGAAKNDPLHQKILIKNLKKKYWWQGLTE